MSATDTLPFGPVQMLVLEFDRSRFEGEILPELERLKEAGIIRLIDLLVISREDDGSVLITDYDEISDEYGFEDIELAAIGLVAEEDAQEFAQGIPPGTSGALLAIELLWAKNLASKFAASGGIVLQTERIPAPVVNAVLAEAEEE